MTYKLNKVDMVYKTRPAKMRRVELLTKGTFDEKLANKENLLITDGDNVVIDRESVPGKTLIQVVIGPEDVILLPETNVIVDGGRIELSKYIEKTSIGKVVVRDILPEEKDQAEAASAELERLRSDNTPEADRKAPILIQRHKKDEEKGNFDFYDIYVLIRPSDTPTTWRLKRIGGEGAEHAVFEKGATAGTPENPANFYSYIKPVEGGELEKVGMVRNIDNFIGAGESSDYNDKDGISVAKVNKLSDMLHFTETETETF